MNLFDRCCEYIANSDQIESQKLGKNIWWIVIYYLLIAWVYLGMPITAMILAIHTYLVY
jgi:hypothetical protein